MPSEVEPGPELNQPLFRLERVTRKGSRLPKSSGELVAVVKIGILVIKNVVHLEDSLNLPEFPGQFEYFRHPNIRLKEARSCSGVNVVYSGREIVIDPVPVQIYTGLDVVCPAGRVARNARDLKVFGKSKNRADDELVIRIELARSKALSTVRVVLIDGEIVKTLI